MQPQLMPSMMATFFSEPESAPLEVLPGSGPHSFPSSLTLGDHPPAPTLPVPATFVPCRPPPPLLPPTVPSPRPPSTAAVASASQRLPAQPELGHPIVVEASPPRRSRAAQLRARVQAAAMGTGPALL
eukprot:EG_transcript_20929